MGKGTPRATMTVNSTTQVKHQPTSSIPPKSSSQVSSLSVSKCSKVQSSSAKTSASPFHTYVKAPSSLPSTICTTTGVRSYESPSQSSSFFHSERVAGKITYPSTAQVSLLRTRAG